MSLGHLAILRGIADHRGVGHLRVESLEALFELIQFLRELHGRSGDDQLATLRLFERHGAFERMYGNRGLVI